MKRWIWMLIGAAVALASTAVVSSQGPYGPLATRIGYSDNSGSLFVYTAGACSTAGPVGPLATRIVRADSTGALYVCFSGTPTFADIEVTDSVTLGGNVALTGELIAREAFLQSHIVVETDFTAAVLTDAGTNYALGSPAGIVTFREEQEKTTSSWVDSTGALDISADNTIDNEGVEIVLTDITLDGVGHIVTGTTGGCFEAKVSLALIAGTDQFLIGWRNVEAFDAANDYTSYHNWSVVGTNNVDGSIVSLGEVADGGTLTDDSKVNMANADVRQFKVCIDATTRVPTAFYTADNGTTYFAILMDNSGTAKTAGLHMAPFITYMHSNDAVDTAPLIHWFQITGK